MRPETLIDIGYDIHGFAASGTPVFWLSLAVAWAFLYLLQTRL